MTQIQIENYRKILQARVIEFDRSTRRRDNIRIEASADSFDRRLEASAREFAVKHLEAESARLYETRAALRRIEDGTYGICLGCEEPISPARLGAVPWAALCIQCQHETDCRCGARTVRPALAMAA